MNRTRDFSVSAPGRVDSIADLCAAIRRAAMAAVSADLTWRLEMVAAETLNNIVEHAYHGGSDELITVGLSVLSDTVELTVCDTAGASFTGPTCPEMPPINPESLADLPEGGFGLAIIAELADSVRREAGPDGSRQTFVFRERRE